MTHERARFFLTLLGAIIPIIALGAILAIFVWAPSYAAPGALLVPVSAILIMVGQFGFTAAALGWNCGECDQRYFAFLMPYWLFDRNCQNCHLPD
jgi:hypothetical protein